MYHIRVAPKEIGRYILLTGDPDRVKIIVEYLDNSQIISEHREFTVHNGYVEGELLQRRIFEGSVESIGRLIRENL